VRPQVKEWPAPREIVGAAVNAATGTVSGISGVEERLAFREYVVPEHYPHSGTRATARRRDANREP
jgi:hypothetical protein